MIELENRYVSRTSIKYYEQDREQGWISMHNKACLNP